MQNAGTLCSIHVSIINTRKMHFYIQKQNSYEELTVHNSRTEMTKSPELKKIAIPWKSHSFNHPPHTVAADSCCL